MTASERYANLLPELLLVLVGNPGDAFIASGSGHGGEGAKPARLGPAVDWVTPPEREQLDVLAALGCHYTVLEEFVERTQGEPQERGGLYQQSLAIGVSELLDVYRLAVLQVEQHVAHFPAPPLLALRQFLHEFEVLLPEAAALVAEVAARSLSGARIMALLAARARCGDPALQSCMLRLLWHCRQTMYRQLEGWVVHGLLLDQGQEFFIQRVAAADGSAEAGEAADGGASPLPTPLRLGSLDGGAGAALDWGPLEWHAGFQVSLEVLPPGVSVAAADAVLFTGKAVRVLKQPMGAAASHQALRAHGEVLGFAAALHELQAAEVFRPADFELAVETMRSKVAGLLWELVRHRCDMMAQFEATKSYFLLGRGDFYQALLDEAAPLLRGAPKPNTAEADIALTYQLAALKSTAEVDPLFGSTSLRWAEAGGDARGLPAWHPAAAAVRVTFPPALDAWDGLFLETAVEWPLQLLFPPDVLAKYGGLWQYLFRLKRVQLDLDAAWASLQALQHGGRGAAAGGGADQLPRLPHALRVSLWQQRQRMAHFIGNLQMYIQVDVIDACFAGLRGQVAVARDFTEADAVHRAYVDSLVTQTFLDMRQMMGLVEGVFKQCSALCALIQGLAAGEQGAEAAGAALAQVKREFRVKHGLLFQLLQSSKLQSHHRAPALRQLVLRLNFNGHNEREALAQIRREADVS